MTHEESSTLNPVAAVAEPTEYTVVLRARSAARFLPEQGCEFLVNAPALDLDNVRIRTWTAWIDNAGKSLPRELMVEVRGHAVSLDEAVKKFAVLARPVSTVAGFVANVRVGLLDVWLAYESTPTSVDRLFVQTFLPDERGAVSDGRMIRTHLMQPAFSAVIGPHADRSRVERALHHYELALRAWYVGGEWQALNHLWIAAEALTKALIRKTIAYRRITEEDLAHEYDLETDDPKRPRWPELLGARVRHDVIFRGDTSTYKTARAASDGIEHGYMELDEIYRRAIEAADKTFAHVRRAILQLLSLPRNVTDELMQIKPTDVQSFRKSIRGRLVGASESPAMDDYSYPYIEWSSGIDSVVRDGSSFQFKYRERMTFRIHSKVRFEPERMEVFGRLEDGKIPVKFSQAELEFEEVPDSASRKLLDAVMPLVDAAVASGADHSHTVASTFAYNTFGQAISHLKSILALINVYQPVEALAALRSLVLTCARFEQMSDPLGPGLGIAVRCVLDDVAALGSTDPALVTAQTVKVEAAATAANLRVPATLEPPESADIYQSLQWEMHLAADVVNARYGAALLHVARLGDEHTGFQVALEPGPLTDLVASAAVIATLHALSHAAPLFSWTTDTEQIARLLVDGRALNDKAAREDLRPTGQAFAHCDDTS